jgi:hypothetical protein
LRFKYRFNGPAGFRHLSDIYRYSRNDSLSKYYGEILINKFPYQTIIIGMQSLGEIARRGELARQEREYENKVKFEKLMESDYSPRQWRLILFHHYFLAEDKIMAKKAFEDYVARYSKGIYSGTEFCFDTGEYLKMIEIK